MSTTTKLEYDAEAREFIVTIRLKVDDERHRDITQEQAIRQALGLDPDAFGWERSRLEWGDGPALEDLESGPEYCHKAFIIDRVATACGWGIDCCDEDGFAETKVAYCENPEELDELPKTDAEKALAAQVIEAAEQLRAADCLALMKQLDALMGQR